jgi:4,5-dihydroxyphthalate decarboxylase
MVINKLTTSADWPPLKCGFWNYDRTQTLIDGRVTVEGYDLAVEVDRPEITFAKAFNGAAFDVCELSFSNTVTVVSKSEFPYTLIPAFLSRAFRHSAIFIRTDRNISTPEDLKGKAVGLQEYDMTAAVVIRGFLRDRYGVNPADIRWKVGELERVKPLEFPLGRPPADVAIEILSPDKSLETRLLDGELDAMISLKVPQSLHGGAHIIARLFPDPTAAEKHWFRQSRIFPIMHAVGVRKTLVEKDRQLPRKLFEAFCRAKAHALSELAVIQAPKVTLPWPHTALAEAQTLIGADPWPYGISANRHVLETQLRWSQLDGLQARPISLQDLFDASCLDT